MNKTICEQLRLYLVTDRDLSLGRPLEEIVTEAVAGGATMVQLREKEASTADFVALARQLKAALAPLGVPLVINDRIDVALAADADGVHIGQSDMPYEDARRLLGPDKIIGLSVESLADIEAANLLACLRHSHQDRYQRALWPGGASQGRRDERPPHRSDWRNEYPDGCRRRGHRVQWRSRSVGHLLGTLATPGCQRVTFINPKYPRKYELDTRGVGQVAPHL